MIFSRMTIPETKVVLNNISYMEQHNRIVRREVKDFIINEEDKNLHRFKYLKPRPCLKCRKLFHDSVDMLLHIQASHIKMVTCKNCGKTMTNWKYKRTHITWCKGRCKKYQCGRCGETVASQQKLTNHTRTVHTPSLENRCVFCEKKFVSRAHLRTHLQTHRPDTHRTPLAQICPNKC